MEDKNNKFNKVIIWGFPLHTHTLSYVHYGWHKGFKHLGYDTYWFDNDNIPKDFEFKKCLFITESYADDKIPLDSSNIYFVHTCINPDKYINIGARCIDIRYNVKNIKDCNYNYSLEDEINSGNVKKISSVSYYQKLKDNSGISNNILNKTCGLKHINYEAFYTSWATDLLPNEFNLNDINIEKENNVYWVGSIAQGNYKNILKLKYSCDNHKPKINFIFNDPWKNPLSAEKSKELLQKSYITPDIRGDGDESKIANGENGDCHKQTGYLPCRIFKAISYGCLGITNSLAVKKLFNDSNIPIIYSDDEYKLLELGEKHKNDDKLIKKQMEFVKQNHTYINRINDLLSVI